MSDIAAGDSRLVDLLRRSGLFGELKEEDLSVIAEYGAFRSYQPGKAIFRQGSRAKELYIVSEGTVVVRKTAEDGREQDLARFTAGEVFGEVDLLDTVPRSASAFAEEPSTVLVFPAGSLPFRDIVEGYPQIFAPVLHTLLATVAHRIREANRLISDRTPWIRELQRQLHCDKLTGLYNRAWLDDELDALLRRRPPTSVLVVKPDNFKAINDTYGHEAGDRVLAMMAETARALLRDGEAGARYRGDEYCLILPGTGTAEAVKRAERLKEAIASLDLRAFAAAGGAEPRLRASIGVSTFPDHCGEAKGLIARAFEKMLAARGGGGDRILWS